MAKWFGKVGYADMVETRPGVHNEVISEREYYGDVFRDTQRLQSTEHINDDVNISNVISIVSDSYAIDNTHKIRYAEYLGVKWKVSNVEVLLPRLKLTLGGLYNVQKR